MKLGIDIGGSHIGIGVVSEEGKIVEKSEKRITEEEKRDIKKAIEDYIIECFKNYSKKYEITSVGIAIPGTLNDRVIKKAVNLGVQNYDIVSKLESIIKVPIIIKNDAKCAAVAENVYGCLKNYDRSVFLTLGTGIGGAVIINNKLLDTGSLSGCEIGHMVIEKNGIQCNCGRKGCFERYASMKNFKNKLRKELGLTERTRGEELLNLIRNNKPGQENYETIERVVSEFIEDLSIGIANLINIFESEAIGIGGSFVFFEDALMERLKEKLINSNMLFNSRDEINIECAILGNDAGVIGATLNF